MSVISTYIVNLVFFVIDMSCDLCEVRTLVLYVLPKGISGLTELRFLGSNVFIVLAFLQWVPHHGQEKIQLYEDILAVLGLQIELFHEYYQNILEKSHYCASSETVDTTELLNS